MKKLIDQVGCLSIDLAAIKRNWQCIQEQVGPAVTVSAVVKADAYGLGVVRVAPALYEQGCRHFYVATLSEAIQLRSLLAADASVYLLAGVAEGGEHYCLKHGLIPVLSSLLAIESWLAFCSSKQRILPSVIKFDSGMTRLGLSFEDLEELVGSREPLKEVGVVGFMSHLACADECLSDSNAQQLKLFNKAAQLLKNKCADVWLSLANSSGIYLSGDYHFDLVRPGAALYGVNPAPRSENPMLAVVTLKLPILQVKSLTEDAKVGYGGDFSVSSGAVLAVVQGGYADGLNRILAVRPYAFVDGIKIPLVGRISMDSCVFDVSAIAGLQRGDIVDVFLDGASLSDLAVSGRSLGYEVLTSLGPRYQRVYLDDK